MVDKLFSLLSWIIAVCIIALVILTILLLFVGAKEKEECELKGGKMIEVGKSTTYVMSGKALVPVTTTQYECNR